MRYKAEYTEFVEEFERWAKAQPFYALFDECLIGWKGAADTYKPRLAELEARLAARDEALKVAMTALDKIEELTK